MSAEEASIERCQALAAQLERVDDPRLELEFRRAVEAYSATLQQKIVSDGGLSAEDLHGATDADAAQCTVDLDLRFLGRVALSRQAARLHATVDAADLPLCSLDHSNVREHFCPLGHPR